MLLLNTYIHHTKKSPFHDPTFESTATDFHFAPFLPAFLPPARSPAAIFASAFLVSSALLHPAATFASRSSVSGYLRTSSTSAAACGFGLSRPCSHFSSVLTLIRSFRAKTAREHRIRFRVSRMNLEFTAGRGLSSTL